VVKCPPWCRSSVTLVLQALRVTEGESHTERGGAKLEHGKEFNVTERRATVLNGSQWRWIFWGTRVSADLSPLWTGSVRVGGSSPLSSILSKNPPDRAVSAGQAGFLLFWG